MLIIMFYIKMLAVYYQKSKKQNKTKENNKEKKTLAKGIKIFLKRGKTKNTNTLGKKEEKEKEKWQQNEKQEYPCEQHKNLSKDEKQRLVEYKRNYYISLKKSY